MNDENLQDREFSILAGSIMMYVGNHKRPLIEGEKKFRSQHVIKVGAIGMHEVMGLVLSTSQPKTVHEVILKLWNCSDPSSWMCTCTCKAGLGHMCKHIVGVLFYLNQ